MVVFTTVPFVPVHTSSTSVGVPWSCGWDSKNNQVWIQTGSGSIEMKMVNTMQHRKWFSAVVLLLYVKDGLLLDERYCSKSLETMQIVKTCPRNKNEMEEAAKEKNCSYHAKNQSCTAPERFRYHCVINVFRNQIIEVCAPERNINGFCTEFNVKGARIQDQYQTDCTGLVPPCPARYSSTNAYLYQACYPHSTVSTNTTNFEISFDRSRTTPLSNLEQTSESGSLPGSETGISTLVIVFIIIGIVLLVSIPLSGIFLWRSRRNREKRTTCSESENDKPKGKSKSEIDLEEMKPLVVHDLEDKITRRKIQMGTATDRYTFITKKTKAELAEENIDETKKYMKSYKTFNRYFVETKMYKSAKTCLDKYNIVIMSGPPGCGKTNAAIHMLFKAEEENFDIRKFGSWEEFTFIDANKKTVVFIDNALYETDNCDLENWWRELDKLHEMFLKQGIQNSEVQSTKKLRLIITARENVIENACQFMKRITPVFNETYREYANNYPLTNEEKGEIFQNQIEFAKKEKYMRSPSDDSQEFRQSIFRAEGPIGFPLCAHLYACKDDYRRRGAKFFSHPIEFLKIQIEDEVHNDQTSKTKTLFFVLFLFEWHLKTQHQHAKLNLESEVACRKFLNTISPDFMDNFSPLDFKELERYARHLGSFFTEVEKREFKFVHESVYEALGTYFCERYFDKVIPFFPFDVIQAQQYTSLRKDQISKLVLRFLYEAFNQRFSKVFRFNVFKLKTFSDCFCEELEKKGDKDIKCFFSLLNEDSTDKLPVLFWVSLNKHHYLVDKMFCILSKHDINTDYQFYLSLYGECCSRSDHLVTRLSGMPLNNLQEIKTRVLDFKDEEKNTVLHLLILSERSDSTVAEAVMKLIRDKANINARNNLNMTPLMVAVQQKAERTAVIKMLVESKAEVKYKDRNGATVFHHCMNSENNDETCVKNLKLLLGGTKSKRILNSDDNDGESVLNVAAKQNRYSRLLSILTILECEDVNASALNLDGCSPVYNAVKHLQVKTLLGELECCARLIILILYGVNPDKVADDRTSAKQVCCAEFTHALKILNNHDTETMKIEISKLIAVVQETIEMKANINLPDCSSKLPESIKLCIRKVVQYMASAELY